MTEGRPARRPDGRRYPQPEPVPTETERLAARVRALAAQLQWERERVETLEREVQRLRDQLHEAHRPHEDTFNQLLQFRTAIREGQLVHVEDVERDQTYAGVPRRFVTDGEGRIRAVQLTTLGGWEVEIGSAMLHVIEAVSPEWRRELEELVDEEARKR